MQSQLIIIVQVAQIKDQTNTAATCYRYGKQTKYFTFWPPENVIGGGDEVGRREISGNSNRSESVPVVSRYASPTNSNCPSQASHMSRTSNSESAQPPSSGPPPVSLAAFASDIGGCGDDDDNANNITTTVSTDHNHSPRRLRSPTTKPEGRYAL